MSIVLVKLGAIFAIFAMGILGGLIPLAATRKRARRRFLSLGNALAGGLFLGAGFVHLLPEADHVLEGMVDYPLAPLLAAAGVALLLFIDRVVFEIVGSRHAEAATPASRSLIPLVLLFVLSTHSVIAGIALGVQPEIAHSILVMCGILLHKGSAAFALIVSAQSSGFDRAKLRTMLIVFALMTPVGILLGMSATELVQGAGAALIEGCFSALAAGTFIYIAILDILDAEMSKFENRVHRFVGSALRGSEDVPMPTRDTDRVMKFLLVIVGFGSMAILAIWM